MKNKFSPGNILKFHVWVDSYYYFTVIDEKDFDIEYMVLASFGQYMRDDIEFTTSTVDKKFFEERGVEIIDAF